MNGAGEDHEGTAVRRDRFSGGPAREFLSSLAGDRRIFAADLAVDRAHVVMLAEQGIIDGETAGEILAALDDVEASGHDGLPAGEDVHEAIETAVIDRIGPDGGKMHTARSRNDEVATCIRYRLRSDLLDAIEATIALREVLCSAAEEHVGAVMPGYTHLQPAQPTTVGHYLLSYESAVARDTARLLDAYGRTNRSPLGAAAFAGTPFDVDRERTAALLGFDGIVRNSMDAASARDFLAEATGALATHAVTLSGLAEDLVLFSNRGFLELDDDYASTSSIMPQKKNPDTLELVRGVAGDAVGAATATLSSLKGLPRAYNRDLQRVHPHAFDAVDAVIDATDVAGGAVATASWDETALADAAGEGFSTATGVADLLAMAGIPFRTAHEVVATAAERFENDVSAAKIDAVAEEVTGESLFAHVSREDVRAALDPAESVASRDSVGGPAEYEVEAAVEAATDGVSADETAANERRDRIETARKTLAAEVATYV
ncbi:argininosuccinate lyase [Halalkaliarchaeum desulfuricum]|uniref:Argininosuccinate lyase n=1 Tax=Halalkaliarchaeum desulfuricum TaxID=2055893 RepID=A0A343TF32_9EURY|nr:argininosuccinate lyase [Halalkaliarchaeum desulfuricum]AUX07704.1 argininosuccinate lyase [Halalkaliarchaeum desulfuricum]